MDEIKEDILNEVEQNIIDISNKYSNIPIIVSSRPNKEFISWNRFTEYSVSPLSIEQINKLADISPFDKDKVLDFKNRVKKSLYDSHRGF